MWVFTIKWVRSTKICLDWFYENEAWCCANLANFPCWLFIYFSCDYIYRNEFRSKGVVCLSLSLQSNSGLLVIIWLFNSLFCHIFLFQRWLKQWRKLLNWMWSWQWRRGIWCLLGIRMLLGQEGHRGGSCLPLNRRRRPKGMNKMWSGLRSTGRGLKTSSLRSAMTFCQSLIIISFHLPHLGNQLFFTIRCETSFTVFLLLDLTQLTLKLWTHVWNNCTFGCWFNWVGSNHLTLIHVAKLFKKKKNQFDSWPMMSELYLWFCWLVIYIGGDFNHQSSRSLVLCATISYQVSYFLVIFLYICLGGAFSSCVYSFLSQIIWVCSVCFLMVLLCVCVDYIWTVIHISVSQERRLLSIFSWVQISWRP